MLCDVMITSDTFMIFILVKSGMVSSAKTVRSFKACDPVGFSVLPGRQSFLWVMNPIFLPGTTENPSGLSLLFSQQQVMASIFFQLLQKQPANSWFCNWETSVAVRSHDQAGVRKAKQT